MAIEKIALDNVKEVIENEAADVVVTVDPATAVAYEDSVSAAEGVEEIETELEKKFEEVATEAPEAPAVKEDSIYTKKLTLDESFDDFNISVKDFKKRSNDDEDRYIEFDMFDFIYSLFSSQTDSLIRPLKALSNSKGRGRKKADDTGSAFMYQGSDDYVDETGEKGVEGVAQISTDADGNVVLYQDTVEAFNRVIELCDEYGFEYEGPTPKKAPWVRWNFSFVVHVPTYADGYPMEVEDYFEQRGIAIEDVMPPEFIRGRSKDYKKLDKEVKTMLDFDAKELIQKKFDEFVVKAANSDAPLETFINDMFAELDAFDVAYDKDKLSADFYAEFDDDFEDEE